MLVDANVKFYTSKVVSLMFKLIFGRFRGVRNGANSDFYSNEIAIQNYLLDRMALYTHSILPLGTWRENLM